MTRHRSLAIASAIVSAVACHSSPGPANSPAPAIGAGAAGIATNTVSALDSTGGTLAGCPGGNGIHISATAGTLTDSSSMRRPSTDSSSGRPPSDSSSARDTLISLDQSVDTTLVFDIARKTWTRTNIAAAISVGIADESRGRYAICAGVTALIPSANLTITGARGRVHFAASLTDLTNSLRIPPAR